MNRNRFKRVFFEAVLPKPQYLNITASDATTITYAWTNVLGADGYEINIYSDAGRSTLLDTFTGVTTPYVYTKSVSTNYFAVVRAYKGTQYSEWSNEVALYDNFTFTTNTTGIDPDKTMVVTPSGGTQPYRYSINTIDAPATYQASDTFTGLADGTYYVYVQDAFKTVTHQTVVVNSIDPDAQIYINTVTADGGTEINDTLLSDYFVDFKTTNSFFTDDHITGLKISGGNGIKKYSVLGSLNGENFTQGTGVNQPAFSTPDLVWAATKYMGASPDAVFKAAGDFYFSGIFKLNAYNNYQQVFSTASDGSSTLGFWVEIGSARGLTIFSNGVQVLDDNVVDISGAGTPLLTGQWYHIELERSGLGVNNVQVHIGGVLIGQASYNLTFGDDTAISVMPLLGGYANGGLETVFSFDGNLKSHFFMNGTITGGQKTSIYAIQSNGL